MILTGKHLTLREVRPSDAAGPYHAWMNDPQVTRYLESRFSSHSVADLEHYITQENANPNSIFLAITLKDNGRHIGNIKVGAISWYHRHGEMGIIIGEKDCWGKGYATEAIHLLCDYLFKDLAFHKICAGCYGENKGSEKAFLQAGFNKIAVRKSHWLCEGKYQDQIILERFE